MPPRDDSCPDGAVDDLLPPVSGAWRGGLDPVGRRRFVGLPGPVALENGASLPAVTVAYETWGRLDPAASNALLVLHALTGDSHAAGPAGPGHSGRGWWDAMIGPGRPIDTERYFVVCPNVLGGCQGTTGPSSTAADGRPWGSRWPEITIGDQVLVEALLADQLGIRRFAGVIGGSMGGMRALEWALRYPDRVARAVVVACGVAATAEQIALYSTQIAAITSDPGWCGGDYHHRPVGAGPHAGMGLARRMAQVSYRSERELAGRFGNRLQLDGRFAAQSYVEHHADKLVRRFDAGTYVTLTQAMMTQNVGRGRGGVAAALSACPVPMAVAGVDSDRLYPLYLQREIADAVRVPALAGGLAVIRSLYGHDAFLLETEQVTDVVREALEAPPVVPAEGPEQRVPE
ncbi:Homoserine O-acetyltransferase [Candidatus Protofrankia californiensis]|uniref:Homoserine O-acetyltransferase n=1 Tax=Candidatus Protofrankia californiensis TaxID=1839754 RepID=A0A1C3PBU0_9ACTN|nr:Homoserine O-acetyltransferase [Candidatus Protofrankia californiensis]